MLYTGTNRKHQGEKEKDLQAVRRNDDAFQDLSENVKKATRTTTAQKNVSCLRRNR